MSKRQPKIDYWRTAPMPRGQLVLFPTTLEQRIPDDHPVRAVDEMLDRLDWSEWEAKYHGAAGQPPIHPSDELDELFDDGQKADQLPEALRELQARREMLDKAVTTLGQMDADRSSWVKDAKKNPAQLPITDPDSRILPNKEGGYAANYTPMAVTDEASGLIVDADVLIGNVEHAVMGAMVDAVRDEYGVAVDTMMADTAYSDGENLTAMQQREVELLAPLAEPKCKNNPAIRDDPQHPVAEDDLGRLPVNPRTRRLDKSAFVYDEADDCYYCPAGKKLPRSGSEKKKTGGGKVIMQANYTCRDCVGCALADRCRKDPNAKKGRKITHDENEPARRRHRQRMATADAKERYKRRQHVGETPFAVIKACFGLRRFLLRGIEGVQTEWLWHCTAFNLKRMLNLLASLRADGKHLPQTAIS